MENQAINDYERRLQYQNIMDALALGLPPKRIFVAYRKYLEEKRIINDDKNKEIK
jgi:hypothetical protein